MYTDDDELQSQSKDGSGDEEDEAEDDTNIDICRNSLAGLSLTERLARVKIGETPLACEKQSGTRKSGPKVKARRGTRASASLSSQEQSEEDSDLVRVRGKGRRDLALGPRTAKQLSKGLPKFSVDRVEDPVGSSEEKLKTEEVHGGKNGTRRPKKPSSKHRRGQSMIEGEVGSLVKGEPVVRPSSSAGISAADALALAGQLGKMTFTGADAKITFNLNINYGTTYFK